MQVTRDYDKELLDELPKGASVQYEGVGIRLMVPCKHGHDEGVLFGKRFPAETIRRMLSNKGWLFNGKRATCPTHADNRVKGSNVTQISEAIKAATDDKVVPIASPPAKHAKRDALRWLDESFDTVAGRYKDGMTDAKIAEETGLSVKAIADLRAEFGYDLKTPPEIVAMLEEAATIKAEAEAMRDDIAAAFTSLAERARKLEVRIAAHEVKA